MASDYTGRSPGTGQTASLLACYAGREPIDHRRCADQVHQFARPPARPHSLTDAGGVRPLAVRPPANEGLAEAVDVPVRHVPQVGNQHGAACARVCACVHAFMCVLEVCTLEPGHLTPSGAPLIFAASTLPPACHQQRPHPTPPSPPTCQQQRSHPLPPSRPPHICHKQQPHPFPPHTHPPASSSDQTAPAGS